MINNKTENINIFRIFDDKNVSSKLKNGLPKLFHIAELESCRAGKIGMEVGSVREKIIIAFLIYVFGEQNVNTQVRITEPEIDVFLGNKPFSIKTITGNGYVKAVWTVDVQSATNFINNYKPKCDILLVKINWKSKDGGFFIIPLEAQLEIFNKLGEPYI